MTVDLPLEIVQGVLGGAASFVAERYSGVGRKETMPIAIRYHAYRNLRASVLRTVYGIDLVSEVRLTLSGALWSWTVVVPAWRSLSLNLREVVVAFTEVVCVGTPQVLEAADEVAQSMQRLGGTLQSPTGVNSWLMRTPVLVRGPRYAEERIAALKAVRHFMVVSTDDLAVRRQATVPPVRDAKAEPKALGTSHTTAD
jgi:hypothetical protein